MALAPLSRPAITPSATAPASVVEAAHVALHTGWATPGDAVPEGTGCKDCVPDLTDLVTALWKQVHATGSVPGWACIQASRTLHNAWSRSPIPTDDDSICQDCMGDVSAIVDGILDVTSKAVA